MLLVLDFGNTQIKAAVFEKYTLLEMLRFDLAQASQSLEFLFQRFPKINAVCTASVTIEHETVLQGLPHTLKKWTIQRQHKFPFVNAYRTPQTLGLDRMVLAAGAVLAYPNQNRLVIDAGTCITYDFITNQDVYKGGAISPGIHMRYKALHEYTAQLPLLTIIDEFPLTGDSTENSIHSGVLQGILFEIEGVIAQYAQENHNFSIILTGGDANFLAAHLKNSIFANPNFLLESLVYVYQYQHND
ncbi:type III pantothenate kinase [Flavobacterium sp.]|jgi:type III pantothenate kinase|uniref:type III pantothenate kinase n=1 Tax=Flavobacterium sp. TaxID=239 RepID=UPI00334018CB